MLDILNRDPLTLSDMQEFHQALDNEKGFDTDFVRNVAYMAAEVGEVLNAYRGFDSSRADNFTNDATTETALAGVAEELADCLAYVVKLANYADIDLEDAYVAKMSRNISRKWDPEGIGHKRNS